MGSRKKAKLIVGNKVDCREEREVCYDEAKELADSYGIVYIEASAKTGEGLTICFEVILYMMKNI